MKKLFTFLSLLLLGTSVLVAQADGRAALDYLQTKYADLGLTAADVAELKITDNYESGGIRHVYINQLHQGLPVYNTQAILHFRGAKLVAQTSDLMAGLTDLQLNPAPAFSAQNAVSRAVSAVTTSWGVPVQNGRDGSDLLFDLAEVSPNPIRAQLVFLPTDKGMKLAWVINIDQHAAHSDYWLIKVDANDGSLLDQDNLVLKCNFGSRPHEHNYGKACADVTPSVPVSESLFSSTLVADGAKYNVYAFGVESPIHGERSVEVDPADADASPFGWHDTNGQEGAEFTYTRGNNVQAYLDRDGDDSPDDFRAEGGDSLVFDFFYEQRANVDTIRAAALTQLFYTNNMLHDWMHHHGFDEASGNFQRRNYGDDGQGRDEVLAEAQDGAGTNNANFFTPPDGSSGVMQMFLWTASSPKLRVTSGGTAIEGAYTTGDGLFGPSVPMDTAIIGQLAIALDGSALPQQVCEAVVNGDDIVGKIALIMRGECNFENKVFNAGQAGAVAAIVCNDAAAGEDRGGIINMADGDEDLNVTIPSLFLTKEDCDPIYKAVQQGDSVTVTIQDLTPPAIDGDFDNGIVAHELGHGISNRLVGGSSNTGCLGNDEQMGEGWSDFYSVASTPQTLINNPDGSEARGIGNFAADNGVTGRGIRSQPYSTDFSINNKTYDSAIEAGANAAPHPLGEVWAAVLLDLYWNLVNRDGLDPDLITGTGGNNLAVRLVTEGLKYTRCQPGILDGRDGIIQADEILFEGANSCLIWETFARRGMGFSADQGSRNDRTDNQQAFDLSPYCVGGVQLVKTVDVNTINPGEGVTYTLEATSYRDGLTKGVAITDNIPDGMTLDESSVRGVENWSVEGNVLTFTVGEMEFEDIEVIEYSVASDPDLASSQLFFDGVEDGDDNWELDAFAGTTLWEQNDTTPYAGDIAWFIPNVPSVEDQALRTFESIPVIGDKPALRFFTKYETEPKWDAGIVEVSTDGTNWEKVDANFLRGRYRGEIAANGTAAIRDVGSFWGVSDDYVEIIIDLSDYTGTNVFVRFHWFSDTSVSRRGWWVDNIELLDVVHYESTATLTSDENDNWVTEVGDLGVLVESQLIDNTNDPVLGQTKVSVFPNPAGAYANVRISSERAGDATIQLFSVDGRVLHNERINLLPGTNVTTLNTQQLPAGIYVVQVSGANRVSTTKLTVE